MRWITSISFSNPATFSRSRRLSRRGMRSRCLTPTRRATTVFLRHSLHLLNLPERFHRAVPALVETLGENDLLGRAVARH